MKATRLIGVIVAGITVIIGAVTIPGGIPDQGSSCRALCSWSGAAWASSDPKP